jgi:hypothetical protein
VVVALAAVIVTLASPAEAAEHSPARAPSTSTAVPPTPPYNELVAAGDLGGDGRDAVLDIRTGYASSKEKFGVTARDGRTGRTLWAFHEQQPVEAETSAYVVPLGPRSTPGVLVVDSIYVAQTSTQTLELHALSGKSGSVLWTRTFSGLYEASGTHHVPIFAGITRDGPGHPVRIVIESDGGDCNAHDCTSQALAILGSNGARHKIGALLTNTGGYPRVQAIPDVNGDGKGDIAIIDPGSPGYVMAESAITGKKIWKTSLADVETVYSELDALSSRGKPLFAYINSGPFPGPFTISLLNAKGKLLWTRTTDSAVTVNLAGTQLRPAIELQTTSASQVNSITYQATMTARALGLGGRVLWTRAVARAATNQTPGGPLTYTPELSPLGDVQPDGARESIMSLTVSNGDATSAINGVLDGRTGVLHIGPYQFGTDGSLRRGDATDLAAGTINSSHELRVTTWRGSTRKLYYARNLAGLGDIADERLTGVRVTGHRCSDFALAAVTPFAGDEDAVLSARGTILWTVRFGTNQVVGGTRTLVSTPAHYCVSGPPTGKSARGGDTSPRMRSDGATVVRLGTR